MTPSLRIGLLTPAVTGYNALDSGIGQHFADLAVGLVAEGHTVWVVTPAPADDAVRDPQLAGVRFEPFESKMPAWLDRLSGWRWQLHSLAGLRHRMHAASDALARCVARENLAIVETTSSGLFAARYLRRRPRARVVTRVSTTAAQLVAHNAGAARWPDRLEQRWEERLVRASDGLITHTLHHRDELCRAWQLPVAAFTIIPHGIRLPPRAALPSPVHGGQIEVLYVGRFECRKGIDVLLAIIPDILAANPRVRFTLVGLDAGNHWQEQFWAANAAIDHGRVSFAGVVPTERLQACYRDCDVFVAPSRYESFGLIYAEAMAWAKPVIGCQTGGVPEVIDDGVTGLLAKPGDQESLRACLSKLVKAADLRTQMGRAARQKTEREFSRTVLAQRSAAFYAEVAVRPWNGKSL